MAAKRRAEKPASAVDRIGAFAAPEPPADLAIERLTAASVEGTFAEVSIDGAELAGLRVRDLRLSYSRLTRTDFTETTLSDLRTSETIFEHDNFSNANLPGMQLSTVTIAQSKFAGAHVRAGSLTNVTLIDCRMDFAAFEDVRFRHVTFARCQLREVEFTRATFDGVRFVDCDLTSATFREVRVTRSEMRRCTLAGVRGLGQLRGFAMEPADIVAHAEGFAAELGIGITEAGFEEPPPQ